MATKYSQISRAGAVLDQSLKRLELGKRLDEYAVWPIWNDVVGKVVANNAQPEKIRNGTLFIKVSSPVWMQQLQYMKEMIAEKLNQRLGAEIVKNLFFVVGRIAPLDREGAGSADAAKAEQTPPRAVDMDFLQSITDPDIRQAFERLLKSFARRKPKGA
jgi:predicted nucleic acid-binding Zn ribbon protein